MTVPALLVGLGCLLLAFCARAWIIQGADRRDLMELRRELRELQAENRQRIASFVALRKTLIHFGHLPAADDDERVHLQ